MAIVANILDGVYIKVGGQAGQTNGLAWHILEEMFSHLQELIKLLAKYELQTDASPDLKEFEIEIFDFKPGSAVPAFRLVPKKQQQLIPVVNEQKVVVAQRFDELLSYANEGRYEQFFKADTLNEVKYEIAEEIYGFILSAERSPITIVEPVINGRFDFKEIYKVPQFNKDQAERLLKPKKRRKAADEPEEIYGLIQRTGKRRKIIETFENADTVLSIAPSEIVAPNRTFILHSPLLCMVKKEDENFIIENEMLDLYAAGSTIDEAEMDFYSEFDSSFSLLNRIDDSDLSERLLRAKVLLNSYVKEITE